MSPASFLGAVLLCTLEILACCVLFQPASFVRLNAHYLMESRYDNYPVLSQRLLALRLGREPRGSTSRTSAARSRRARSRTSIPPCSVARSAAPRACRSRSIS